MQQFFTSVTQQLSEGFFYFGAFQWTKKYIITFELELYSVNDKIIMRGDCYATSRLVCLIM